ncbi:MAG: outer membrane lipoprotein-sorting protein [Desulfovibrionaceae bacterium]
MRVLFRKLRFSTILFTLLLPALLLPARPAGAQESSQQAVPLTAEDLVQGAMDYWRGTSSIATMRMTIHRPDWERRMTMVIWTKGREDSVFKVTEPAKDKGNATLKLDREMWTYNPKVNRTIKIPPSMMSQSWMGSDFSNNDLSKSDSLTVDYDHELIGSEVVDGVTVYEIKCMPKPGAPVVWGMQTVKVREDYIMTEEIFYDEDFLPVKRLAAQEIKPMGGRLFPVVWVMTVDGEEGFTRLDYLELAFDVDVPERYLSLEWLKAPVR